MSDNPLTSRRPAEKQDDPMLRHAHIWQHIEKQPPDALHQHVAFMDYALPILGKLAGDPDVSAKAVIKALSGAVADGKMDASKAVGTLTDMPADKDKLRPWLRERYADALATTVHAKAALMRQGAMPGQQAAPSVAPAPMPQGAPPGATVQ